MSGDYSSDYKLFYNESSLINKLKTKYPATQTKSGETESKVSPL